jgi:hypothetical protein
MPRIERRELANLSRFGSINIADTSDPVSSLLRDLGITAADVSRIGNGDQTIRGAAEFDALFDRLASLDKAAPGQKDGAKVDRASRLYTLIMSRRTSPADRVPAPKELSQIKTKADYATASSEEQTAGAQRVLARIEDARTMPADIKAAAEKAIDSKTSAPEREAAQKKVDAWVTKQATKLDGLRTELARQELHLASLIGWRDSTGEHAGYYDRIIADATKAGRSDVVRWAAREQAEARAVYRDFAAQAAKMGADLGVVSTDLEAVAGVLAQNATVFADMNTAQAKHEQSVTALGNDGKLTDGLLESKDWIGLYDRTQARLLETHKLYETLSARADSDPNILKTLELQKQGLSNQLEVIDDVVEMQKREIEAGKTGYVFAVRDQSVEMATSAVAALTTEDDGALEKRERELSTQYGVVKEELRGLRDAKKQAERTIKALEKDPNLTTEKLFQLKQAHLVLGGAVYDKNNKPISLEKQIRIFEGTGEALINARAALDARRTDIKEIVGNVGQGYGAPVGLNTGSNTSTIDSIRAIDKYAPTPGLTEKDGVLRLEVKGQDGKTSVYQLGKDSSYGNMRKFAFAWAEIHQRQQHISYYVARELLLANGLTKDDLETLGLHEIPTPPQPGFVEERLTVALNAVNNFLGRHDLEQSRFDGGTHLRDINRQLIGWSQKPTKDIPGLPKSGPTPTYNEALLLVTAANTDVNGRRKDNYLTREYLLALVLNPTRTEDLLAATGMDYFKAQAEAPKLIAFAKALLSNPTLQDQLSAGPDGAYDLREVKKFGEQWKAITDYQAQLPRDKNKTPPATTKAPVDPTYFKGAMDTVHAIDPFDAPWGWNSTNLFGHIAKLDAGQRAFTIGLFDAYYSQTRGANYLNTFLSHVTPGEAVAYERILTGSTAKEESENFVKYWLSKPDGIEAFASHHEVGVLMTGRADGRKGIDMPAALMNDYKSRVEKFRALATERAELLENGDPTGLIPGIDQNLKRLAGEMEVLGSALISARNAEQDDYARAQANLRSFVKKLGVAVAATAAAYFTAGAVAPEAGFAWAAVLATSAGTFAGMSVAFTFDVAEQIGEKGIRGVSLGKAGTAALDAAPDAFLAAASTGILTAGMLVRARAIYKGIETARAAGTLTKGMQVAAHGRMAGELAVMATASTYVGNVAAAGFLRLRGKHKEADQLLEHIHRDAIFAGASSALLMPFSRFKGVAGFASDVGTNMAQTIVMNKIAGNPWDAGLADAAVMGGALNRIFATNKNIEAAHRLRGVAAEGSSVRIPGAGLDANWTIKSVDEKRGTVVVENGTHSQKVAARLLLDANPQLTSRTAAPRLRDEGTGSIDADVAAKATKEAPPSKEVKRFQKFAALVPEGSKFHDPSSGNTLTVKGHRGGTDPRILVDAHDANGRFVGRAEMSPMEMIARGLQTDAETKKSVFAAKDVETAGKQVPASKWSKFEGPENTDLNPIVEKGPALSDAGADARQLRTGLEQSAKKILAPQLKQALGGEVDISTSSRANDDGTVAMTLQARPKGQGYAVAEVTITIDPKRKTIHVDDVHVVEAMRGKGIGDRLFAANSDFLSSNFAGWEISAKIPDRNGAAAKLFERNFAGAKFSGDTAKSKIPSIDARIEKIAPKNGFQTADVAKIETNGDVTLSDSGKTSKTTVGDILKQHPETVMGMEVSYKGSRYWVGASDGKGNFELIPQSPDTKLSQKFPKISGKQLHEIAPLAIEALLSPPAVRVKTQQLVGGELLWRDAHGFQLVATDKTNGMAYVRNANGAIEAHAMENIAYEHSGVAFGSMNEAQHARYESRLSTLSDADFVDFYKLRAEAADVSGEHAALLDRAFAAGSDVAEIRGLYEATKNLSQAELGAAFSVKGQTQHFQKSCVAGACLFGLSVVDPVMAKIVKDHPELGAWWQKDVLERNGRGVVPREDGDYAHGGKALGDASSAQPLRSFNDRNWYDAKTVHPSLTSRGLNDKAFWKNREVIVAFDKAGKDVARIYGDDKGNVFIESPMGTKAKKAKLPLFEAVRSGDQIVLGFKDKSGFKAIDEIGLPAELKIPGKDNGMNLLHDAELMRLIELKTGEPFVMRKASDLTPDQLVAGIDTSLNRGLPIQMSVEWHGKDGTALGSSHALWIAEKRTVKGKDEYLIFDPHFDEPRWLGRDQLTNYTNIPGALGKPMEIFLPGSVNMPGPVYAAGGSAAGGLVNRAAFMKNTTDDAVVSARNTLKTADENRKNNKSVDEGKAREAEVVLDFADYAEKNPNMNLRITRAGEKIIGGDKQVRAELDLQTDAVLYEITIGGGDDKLVQFDARRAKGSAGNPYELPVVLIADKAKLEPKVARGLDRRGAIVAGNSEQAINAHNLYKRHGDVMDHLWKLDWPVREKAVGELLTAKSDAKIIEIAEKYGLNHVDTLALHQRPARVVDPQIWNKELRGHMSEAQGDAVRAYVEQARRGDNIQVSMYKNRDGSITVSVDERMNAKSEMWQSNQATFGADGKVVGQTRGDPPAAATTADNVSSLPRSRVGLRVA